MKDRDSKRLRTALSHLNAMSGEQDRLARLEHVRRAREAVDALENECVEAARADGCTWTEIGAVYGMTKQGAQQRFREVVDSTAPRAKKT